jgi:hypothetical protein
MWRATSRNGRSSNYPIGFSCTESAEVQPAEGMMFLFVGINSPSKFAVTQLVVRRTGRQLGGSCITCARGYPIRSTPFASTTVFSSLSSPGTGTPFLPDPCMRFGMACEANRIEHRPTKPSQPWTNGQVGRMNRTIGDATVKRPQYKDHDQLRTHIADVLLRRGQQSTGLSSWARSPTISRGGARHPAALRHMNRSARSGHPSQTDSSKTRSTRCRDQTRRH